jgi:uncharacterized protein
VKFAWDPAKDRRNRNKHGVSFVEAATVFDDPMQWTVGDPDHSTTESRYLTTGYSSAGRLLIVAHSEEEDVIRIISVERQRTQSEMFMRKEISVSADDEMREEYDLRGGVRGKYYQRYQEGTNLVLLDPDIAEAFTDASSVNAALRQFLAEHGAAPSTSKAR